MTGSGSSWLRPPSSAPSNVPPWAAAILVVAGFLLLVNALPMLAEAITPERGRSAPAISVPPSPVPLPPGQGLAPPPPLPLGSSASEDRRSAHERSAADRPTDSSGSPADKSGESPQPPVRGLPWAGSNPVLPLTVALVLLSAGLWLLRMVGSGGERSWPGRYVRRTG